MAQKKEIVLNCGNSHVSASIFTLKGEELVLEQSMFESLHRDLTKDDFWMDSTIKALGSICQKIKGDVRVIFPGSMLISKTIRVPHVEEEKQRKIVSFELSQKMPLPLSELVWDYLVIDDDGVEEEILAFAVKPKIVETFCDRLVKLGLNPVQITPAPVLDYLAVKDSLGDDIEQEILTINIGAKSTNLLFINQTGYLIRTIAIGGNTMSQSISDNLGITFEKAESLKKSYFSQQVNIAEGDPADVAIKNATNQFLARSSQEITRSIVTYKRLKKGKSPQKILLTGRGSFIPSLSNYLLETQQIEVQYFNPLEGISVSPQIPDNVKALFPYMLGEPIGMAKSAFLQSTADTNKQINLLPSAKLSSLGFKQKAPLLIISAILLCLTPIPSIWKNLKTGEKLEKKLQSAQNDIRDLENDLGILVDKKKNLDFIAKFGNALQSLHYPFIDLAKKSWINTDIINYVQGIISTNSIGDIWLDTFSLSPVKPSNNKSTDEIVPLKYKLIISGRYLVRPNLEDEEQNLRDTLIELDRLKKESLTEYLAKIPHIDKIERKTFSTEGKGDLFNRFFSHFEYEISLSVK